MGLDSLGLDNLGHWNPDYLVIVLAICVIAMIAIMAANTAAEGRFGLLGKLFFFALFFGLFVAFTLGVSNEVWIKASQATQWIFPNR